MEIKKTTLPFLKDPWPDLDKGTPQWWQTLAQKLRADLPETEWPTPKWEDWKYTDISPLYRIRHRLGEPRAAASITAEEIPSYGLPVQADEIRIVTVNGVLALDLCHIPNDVEGLSIFDWKAGLNALSDRLYPLYVDRSEPQFAVPFVSVNLAAGDFGVVIHVAQKTTLTTPLHLVHLTVPHDEPTLTLPRCVLVVEEQAQVTLLETHCALDLTHQHTDIPLTDIQMGPTAVVHYIKSQTVEGKAAHIGTTRVLVERDAQFHGFTQSLNAPLIRNCLDITLRGPGASAVLNGLFIAQQGQLIDNHTTVEHQAPHTTSNQLYKGVLFDNGHGVFNGRIVVRPDAQQTNAYQLNKNLLLGDGCRIDTKPQLEIFADDVKCTHGATIGHLDEEEMFYLRTRGLSETQAKTLLTRGFIDDVLETITHPSIRARLSLITEPFLNKL